jgi:hypothetical protein
MTAGQTPRKRVFHRVVARPEIMSHLRVVHARPYCRLTAFITAGTPKQFTRSDLERAVTREFCAECGTHLATRRPGLAAVILKIGTLDEPSLFGGPQMAIYTIDKQAFHQIPDGLPTFERLPRR